MRLPAPSPYTFALSVLDVLFTKEELSSSLLFSSKKSEKPALDHTRVETLLSKYIFMTIVKKTNCILMLLTFSLTQRSWTSGSGMGGI